MKSVKWIILSLLTGALVFWGCEKMDPSDPLGSGALQKVTITETDNNCTTIYAGQYLASGSVCLNDVDTNGDQIKDALEITYSTIDNWVLVEVQFAVSKTSSGIPMTKKGNLIPGQFPYIFNDLGGVTTFTFKVPFSEFGFECDPNEVIYAAAHCVVGIPDGSGGYIQTETGWGYGDNQPGKSWGSIFSFTINCDDSGTGSGKSETAFAFGCDFATCFSEYPDVLDNPNRWGWTNGPLTPGMYNIDLFAGAGQCDLSSGTLVGKVTIEYNGSTAIVTFKTCGGYTIDETHLYVGNNELPDKDGESTVAPGQYPYKHENLPEGTQTDTYSITGLSGEIYVVAHANVLGDTELMGKCGEEGCSYVEPCMEAIYLSDGLGNVTNRSTTLNKVVLDDITKEATVTQLYDFKNAADFSHFDLVNHIGTSPDGAIVYVVDEEEGWFGEYNVATGVFNDKNLKLLLNGSYPGGIVQVAVSPGGVLYVASKVTHEIYTVDISTGALTALANGTGVIIQGSDLTFVPDGTLYLYTNSGSKLYKIDLTTNVGKAINGVVINTGSTTGIATVPGTSNLLLSDTNPNGVDKIIKVNADGSNRVDYTISNFNHTWGDMASSGCSQ